MSFARFGPHSDVYVFSHVDGYISCCGCSLGEDSQGLYTPKEVVDHMKEHVADGDTIPQHLLDPELYEPSDFVPMCRTFMCREPAGHDGDHTPLPDERHQEIRDELERE